MIRMGFQHMNKLTKGTVDNVHDNGVDDTAITCDSSEVSSVVSSDSDLMDSDDDNSSASSSSSPPSSSESPAGGPLLDMSSLMQQLPLKRGLSKYFDGKSQSFTSLSRVMSLEDLAKPENPCNKRMKSCKSYAGLAAGSHFSSSRSSSSHLPRTASSRFFSKKTSPSSTRASSSSSSSTLSAKRSSSSFIAMKRPPIAPPHSSSSTNSFSNHTPIFA